MVSRLFILSLTAFILFFNTSMAQQAKPLIKIKKTPSFNLPIDCDLNEDCWVMNYVDMIPDDDQNTDPACQSRTYDGHKGTDFAILDETTMRKGVNVIAPLNGTVTKIRDGEPDRFPDNAELEKTKLARKECGNAVMINHDDGLQTIYCHLKENSIRVKPNQEVKTGDVLAQVGLSGLTQFPHLHFGIIEDGKIIDPYTGLNNTESCGRRKKSLWLDKDNVQYEPFIIQSTGLQNELPMLSEIEKNSSPLPTIKTDSDLLSLWSVFLGMREGDKISLEIIDPNGKIFAQRQIIQDKNRARQFYYAGRRTTQNPLIEGPYIGTVKLVREYKGQTIEDEKQTEILVLDN